MQELFELLDKTFLGTSVGQFAGAFAALIVALFARKLLAHFFARIMQPLTRRTTSDYDDLFVNCLQKPLEFLVFTAGLFVAVAVLALPEDPINLRQFSQAVLKLMVTGGVAWIFFNLTNLIDTFLNRWAEKTDSALDDHLVPFIRKSLKAFVIVIAAIMAIQNLGYSISGLLASLGIGGLAVALAARDTLSNIFGSLMIILDRPFKIGDWVKAGDMEGTVEEIGFRSTKVRTFAKTLITVPNNIIANLSIDNFSRMPKRRIKLTVGVSYATSPDQMRTAVDQIREMLKDHPAIDQEFFLVNFTEFGASTLDIMVYCFTTTTVWGEYLDARQDVLLKIMDILENLGLEIAFPSRTVYLHNEEKEPAVESK